MAPIVDSDGDVDDEDDSFDSLPPDYPSEADDAGVFWCPKCGVEMYGDASRCPSCGDYVTPGARPSTSTPWWIWAGILLISLALLGGLLAAFLASPIRGPRT